MPTKIRFSYRRFVKELALPKREKVFMLFRLVTGCSVVWLARLLWEQEAVSSNLTIPTIFSTLQETPDSAISYGS
jgi:cytoskeletal protein RodZ